MAASYPTSVKSFTTKAVNDTIQPAHVNDLQDEVTAIETGLLNGINHHLLPIDNLGKDIGSASFRWRDIFGRQINVAPGTITADAQQIASSVTWNNGAVPFTHIKASVTVTAAAATSRIMDLLAAGGIQPIVSLSRAKGTVAAPTVLLANDVLGQLDFHGYTGSAYYQAAAIRAFAMENWSGSAGGSDLEFYTTRTAQQILRLRYRILGGTATSHQFLNSDGTQIATLEHTATSGQTVFFLSYHNGAAVVNDRVTVGAADSGGSGFKLLRVPN